MNEKGKSSAALAFFDRYEESMLAYKGDLTIPAGLSFF